MFTYTPDELAAARKRGDLVVSASTSGVAFRWWLVGADGAGFALLREPNHSDDNIARAKRWLMNSRDGVELHVYLPRKP